ncbi:MAG: FecR domain-containing protein, partial [Rikenellaceae bacterium]
NYKNTKKIAQQISEIMRGNDPNADAEMKEWLRSTPNSQEAIDLFSDEERFAAAVKSFDQNERCEKSLNNLQNNLNHKQRERRIALLNRRVAVAVALIGISLVVWVTSYYVKEEIPVINLHNDKLISTIEVPTLILDNGEDIQLDKVEQIADKKYNKIVEVGESALEYNRIDSSDYTKRTNTLIIPSKFTYTLSLSDGTKVILNANSKLVYPVAFGHESRNVILEGEAFFNVAKSNVPFYVISNGVRIKVYGTKFNVYAYNASSVEAVLLSGSIGVSIGKETEQMLKPNQSIFINVTSHTSKIQDVDASASIDWTKGIIKSYDAELGSLIHKLSNWYGVNFEYFDDAKQMLPITASFDSSQTLESILSSIEYTLKVKFIKNERGYLIY